jgi:thiamine-phosphate pyrophosphorylase
MTTAINIARQLTHRYASLQAGDRLPLPALDSRQPEWKNGVLLACATLGFLPHDAACIANAWQAQSDRLGGFDPEHWPDAPQDFGIAPVPRHPAFPSCPKALGLYAVLPDAQWVKRMADAGVPTVQLRFKSQDATAIAREVEAAVRAVEGSNSLLFINDHWQHAIAAGAYGVHLGQEDMAEAPLEKIHAAGLRLGLSTHGYAEMLKADAASPSYLALGAVFPTTLKRMATAPQGTGRLNAYAALMQHHSLVGIGGIDEARIPIVLKSGVGSIAVVRAITGAENAEAAAARLQKIMTDCQKR